MRPQPHKLEARWLLPAWFLAALFCLPLKLHGQLRIAEVSSLGGIIDEDADDSDWIELINTGAVAVDLAGYGLNDSENGASWLFPQRSLPAGGLMIVLASGKDRAADGTGELHADFAIGSTGDRVVLFDPAGEIVDSLEVPALRTGTSYGLDGSGAAVHFRFPTPGEPNPATGLGGFVEPPEFSAERGYYETGFYLKLTAAAGAQVRYTLDGSAPGVLNGTLYTAPIKLDRTTVVRAIALAPGLLESEFVAHTYLFTRDVLDQPAMSPAVVDDVVLGLNLASELQSLPALSIGVAEADFSGPGGIYREFNRRGREAEVPISMEFFDPATGEEFQLGAGLRIHGGQARFHEKKPLRLYFRSEYGSTELEHPLFKDSPVTRFKRLQLRPGGHDGFAMEWNVIVGGQLQVDDDGNFLLGGRNDLTDSASYVRDEFIRRSEQEMGLLSPRGRYVQLYINGSYWGMYNLHERADAEFFSSHRGGDPEDWDVIEQGGTVSSGEADAWETLMDLSAGGVRSTADMEALFEWTDDDAFIDAMISRIWSGDHDWIDPLLLERRGTQISFGGPTPNNRNWFAGRRSRSGDDAEPFHFFSWDAEISMGNDRFTASGNRNMDFDLSGVNTADSAGLPYQALSAGSEFRLRFADRLQKHLRDGGVLSQQRAVERLDEIATTIRGAVGTESARWGNIHGGVPVRRDVEWESEINWLRERFLAHRSEIVIDGPVEIRFEELAFPDLSLAGSLPLTMLMRSAALGESPVTYPSGTATRLEGGAIQMSFGVTAGEPLQLQLLLGALPSTGTATYVLRVDGTTVDSARPGSLIPDPSTNAFLWTYQWIPDANEVTLEIDTRSNGNSVRVDPYPAVLSALTLERLPSLVAASVSESVLTEVGDADFSGDFSYALNFGSAMELQIGDAQFVAVRNIGIDAAVAGVTLSAPAGHFRAQGLFPDVETPSADPPAGEYPVATTVALDAGGQPGEIFYTTDGSDPRQPSRSRVIDLVPEVAAALTLVPSVANGGANLEQTWKDPESPANIDEWISGETGIGYDVPGGEFDEFINTSVSEMAGVSASVYVRIPFEVTDADLAGSARLVLRMRFDDGFIAFLNGERVADGNAPVAVTWNSRATNGTVDTDAVLWQEFDISADMASLDVGTNVLALQGLNVTENSSDLLLQPQLSLIAVDQEAGVAESAIEYIAPFSVGLGSSNIKARLRHANGQWSALREAGYEIGDRQPLAGELVISELHYRPLPPSGDAELAVASSASDFEFVELHNRSLSTVGLTGVSFSDGVSFEFADGSLHQLPADGYALVVGNRAAFLARYGDELAPLIAGEFTDGSRLSNSGERVALEVASGITLFSVSYDDQLPWPEAADGEGYSLIYPAAGGNPELAASWRASTDIGGSPGGDPATDDSDGDGLADAWEVRFFGGLARAGEGDEDGDGLSNRQEFELGTDPTLQDTDGDGWNDVREVLFSKTDPANPDTDGDGIPDGSETANPLLADSDGDGLQDGAELQAGTDANSADSDGDGITDGAEVLAGTDPLAAGLRPAVVLSNLLIHAALEDPAGRLLTVANTVGTAGTSLGGASTEGRVGSGHSFSFAGDGIDFSDRGDPLQGAQTAMLWFRAPSGSTGTLLGKGNPTAAGDGWSLTLDALGAVEFSVANTSGMDSLVSLPLAADQWHHVAIVVWPAGGTSRATAYVNGLAIGNLSLADGALSSSQTLAAGFSPTDGTSLSGTIDEVALLDYPLDAQQMAYVFAAAALGMNVPAAIAGIGSDTDFDQLPDAWELENFGNLAQSPADDPDADGLINSEELVIGSDPGRFDSDGDGAGDRDEVAGGSDPGIANGGSAAGAYGTDLALYMTFDARDRLELNGVTTVFDQSSPPENGIATGDWSETPGKSNEAIQFSGGRVDVGDVMDIGEGDFAVSLWVKPARVVSGGVQVLAGKGGAAGAAVSGWQLLIDGDRFAAAGALDDGTLWTVRDASASTASGVQPGQWAHVFLQLNRSSGMVEFYVNGREITYGSENRIISGSASNTSESLVIGDGFTGCVDELGIWTRGATADEILALYRGGSAGDSLGTLAGFSGSPELEIPVTEVEIVVNPGQSGSAFLPIRNAGAGVLNWLLSVDPPTAITLEDALARFDERSSTITELIPDLYDFSEGAASNLIISGGGDMYDGGNILGTDFENGIEYSDGVVIDGQGFGDAGRYFTRKVPGMFVMAADLTGVSSFSISGNLGADGGGSVDSVELESEFGTRRFLGYGKRVHSAVDPSVNHLIIIESDGSEIVRTFSDNSDDDGHRLDGINSARRIYYLLFSSENGGFVTDEQMMMVMEGFLGSVLEVTPGWAIAPQPDGAVVAGNIEQVELIGDGAGLVAGDRRETVIRVRSNDGLGEQIVPLILRVNAGPERLSEEPLLLTFAEDGPAQSLDLSAIFSDPDAPFGDLVFTIESNDHPELFGTLAFDAFAGLIVAPGPDRFGSAGLVLRAADAQGLFVEVPLIVEVESVADAPVALGFADHTADDSASALSLEMSDAFADADPADVLRYSLQIAGDPIFSTAAIDAESGRLQLEFLPFASGTALLTVTATDSAGLSAEVEFMVELPEVPAPSVTTSATTALNRQTGLIEQTLTIRNDSGRPVQAVRIRLEGLAAGIEVWNASERDADGIAVIIYPQVLGPGEEIAIIIEYYSRLRRLPSLPAPLVAVTARPLPVDSSAGSFVIDRLVRLADGSVLVEFTTVPGDRYMVQYADGTGDWQDSGLAVRAGGTRVQWIDNGPPKTATYPAESDSRRYRVFKISE